jgi:hypothetical protein
MTADKKALAAAQSKYDREHEKIAVRVRREEGR